MPIYNVTFNLEKITIPDILASTPDDAESAAWESFKDFTHQDLISSTECTIVGFDDNETTLGNVSFDTKLGIFCINDEIYIKPYSININKICVINGYQLASYCGDIEYEKHAGIELKNFQEIELEQIIPLENTVCRNEAHWYKNAVKNVELYKPFFKKWKDYYELNFPN